MKFKEEKGYDPIGDIICDSESQTELTIEMENGITETEYKDVYLVEYGDNILYYSEKYDAEFREIWDKMDKTDFGYTYDWYPHELNYYIRKKLEEIDNHLRQEDTIICALESQSELTIAEEIAKEEYNRVYTYDYYGTKYYYSKKYEDEFNLLWNEMMKSCSDDDYNWNSYFWDKFIMEKINAEVEHDLCELDKIVCDMEYQTELIDEGGMDEGYITEFEKWQLSELERIGNQYNDVEYWLDNFNENDIKEFKIWFKDSFSNRTLGFSSEIKMYCWSELFTKWLMGTCAFFLWEDYHIQKDGGFGCGYSKIYEILCSFADEPFEEDLSMYRVGKDFSMEDFHKGYNPLENYICFLESKSEPQDNELE